MIQPNYKAFAILFSVIGVGAYAVWPDNSAPTVPPVTHENATTPAIDAAGAEFEPIDFADAIAAREITAELLGNGRDTLAITLQNSGSQARRVQLGAGAIFHSGEKHVVLVRDLEIEIAPGQAIQTEAQTAAVSSTNTLSESAYELRGMRMPQLDRLIPHLREHPELSVRAVQTAVLALTENLPASAFASYEQVGGDLPTQFDTSAFQAPTSEIVEALIVLRAIGCRDDQLALTVDPQLKIEAMIDPLAHALAMRYYGIAAAQEWEYWKTELLRGDASTRHYALYGIARFFPDVALDMLPRWAREAKTSPVYRMSAMRALAETQRPEALPVLRQLSYEFDTGTDLGRAAHDAAEVLEKQVNRPGQIAVNFRASSAITTLPEL